MKKGYVILCAALLSLLMAGCGKPRYHVDYHGQKDLFKGARDSYAQGTKVTLLYDLIATDTDYYFFVEGAEFRCDYNEKKHGYEIQFVMPDHDIEVYSEHQNTMVSEY